MKIWRRKSNLPKKADLKRFLSGKYEWKPGDLKKKATAEGGEK